MHLPFIFQLKIMFNQRIQTTHANFNKFYEIYKVTLGLLHLQNKWIWIKSILAPYQI